MMENINNYQKQFLQINNIKINDVTDTDDVDFID
jgi:hypothetical protein